MEDVATRAGVSRAVVSLVMRGREGVSERRRQAVLEAADELGYVPNRLASRLASQHTGTVGLLLLNIRNTVFADIYDGVTAGLAGSGYQTFLAVGSEDQDAERKSLQALRALQIDGLLLAGYTGDAETLSGFSARTPTVVMTRELDAPFVDSVLADERKSARMAVEYLLSLGHREILHIATPSRLPYRERRQGYSEAMSDAGLEPLIVEGDMTKTGGRHAVLDCLGRGRNFTAIFADVDLSGIGAIEALQRQGLRVPEDVSVIGHDYTDLARTTLVDLTSVDQRAFTVGRIGAEMLLERMRSPVAPASRVKRIEPTLNIGGTTRARRTDTETFNDSH